MSEEEEYVVNSDWGSCWWNLSSLPVLNATALQRHTHHQCNVRTLYYRTVHLNPGILRNNIIQTNLLKTIETKVQRKKRKTHSMALSSLRLGSLQCWAFVTPVHCTWNILAFFLITPIVHFILAQTFISWSALSFISLPPNPLLFL